jgi:hypothetical protein
MPALLLVCGALLATVAGCNNAVVVQLMTGNQTFEVTTSAVTVPAELQSGGTIASVPCPTGMCPTIDMLPSRA